MQAPVIARPQGRLSPPIASHRCQPSTLEKNVRKPGRFFAEQLSGVGIHKHGPLAPEIERHRIGGIRAHGQASWHLSLIFLYRCQQLFDWQPLRSWSWLPLRNAIRVVHDLPLVSEQDASHRHNEDHQTSHTAGD